MILSVLLWTAMAQNVASVTGGNTHEDAVQACIQSCYAFIDKPGPELRACVLKCLELGKP